MTGPNRSWGWTAFVVALAVCLVLWAPATVVGPAVGVAAAQSGDVPRTPASYYGTVTVDGDPAPTGTVIEAAVNGTVYGSITVGETGEYGGDGALDEKLTVVNESIENGSEVRFYANNEDIERTEATRAVVDGNSTTITWEPGDVTNVDLAFASGAGLYEATITAVDGSVVAGDSITLDATIENIADNAGDQTVNITLNGEVVAQRDIILGSNETTNISEIVDTGTDARDEVTVGVETVDDRTTETVTVDAPAEFAVTGFETNDVGAAGESFDANVTVENVGDVSGTQNLTVTYPRGEGTVVFDEARTLDAGETDSTNLTIDTEVGDAGEPDAVAETGDDRAIRTLNLSAPAFFAVDVIEIDSDESVVEGQNATVVAEVENTGGETDTQNITITKDGSTVATEPAVELGPGEITTLERDVETSDGDGNSTVDVAVETDDDGDSFDVAVENASAATYTVDILGINGTVNEPVSGGDETIEVKVRIENIGQEDGTQDIDFAVDGDVRDTNETVSLDGTLTDGGTTNTTFNRTIDVESGDAPEVGVTVSSANESATRTVDVTPLPEFAITTVDVPENVEVNAEFTPSVTAENLGGRSGSVNVSLRFNGTVVGTTSTSDIAAGGNETIDLNPLNATEQGVADSVMTQVELIATNDLTDAEDDVSAASVFISSRTPANLTVDSVGVPPDDVVAGESVTVNATVENTGEETASQTVVLEFGGKEIAARTVTLEENETESISVQRTTRFGDVGTNTVSVSTDDDEAGRRVVVLEPAVFDVEIVAVDDPVVVGENVSVDVRARNTGGESAGTDLTVFLNGRQETRSVGSLDGGNATIESFEFRSTVDDVGELDVAATTPNALETATVKVVEPAEFEVTFTAVPGEITTGSPFSSTVRVENVGDAAGTETIRLESDDFSDSEQVTLAGGEVQRIELSDANVPSAGTGTTFQAIVVEAGGDTTGTETVDVIEAPSDPRFVLSSVETRDAVLEPVDEATVTVNTTVTNVGDETGTQSIDLIIDDEQRDSATVTNLASGSSQDVSLAFTLNSTDRTFTDGVDEIALDLSSENRTVSDTLLVEEANPAELDVTDVTDVEPISAGDTFSVNVTVENVGDRDADDGTVTIEYLPTGDTATVAATPNATDVVVAQVGVEVPDAPRAGEFNREFTVTAAAANQTEAAEETVTETVDYGSVRSGVAQATQGDVVLIAPGAYTERDTVVVDTPNVTLEAAGDERPVVAPRNDETAVRVTAENVTLSELILEGDGNGTAVIADDSTTVESTDVIDWDLGIASNDGTATVRSTLIDDVGTGVDFASDETSELAFSTVQADGTGVRITGNGTTLRDSSITGARVGVNLIGTSDVSIDRMRIRRNSEYGLRALNAAPDAIPGRGNGVPVSSTNFESNGVGVLADNSVVNASGSWWGSADTPDFGDEYTAYSEVIVANNADARFAPDIDVSISREIEVPAVRGEGLTVPVNVTNNGGLGADQTVVLTADGGREDSATVSVETSATSVEGSLALELGDLRRFTSDGDVRLGVSSETDSASRTVKIVEPAAFDIDSVDTTNVPLGNDFAVDVTVNNTGGVSDAATVTLTDGIGTVTRSPTIAPGGNATATFTRGTTNIGTGSRSLDVTVTDPDGTIQDTRAASVTIDPAELSSVGLTIGATDLAVGDTTTPSVTETLSDGSTNGVTPGATLSSSNTDVISVGGARLTAVGTGTATITALYTVDGVTRSDSVSVTVSRVGGGGSGGGGGGESDLPSPPEPTEELDVTTTESAVPFLDVATDQRVAEFDTVANVQSITFETSGEIGEVIVSDVNPDTGTVDTPGAGVAVQDIAVPEGARNTSATLEFGVSRERLEAAEADAEDLRAFRGTDDGYEPLETTTEDGGNDTITLTAETPGFSVFTISAVSEPKAVADVTPGTVHAGDEVELSAADSTTEYGELVAYDWTVAGESLSGETATTTLEETGTFDVELTVTNDAGETASTTASIIVEADDEPVDDDAPADGESADDETPVDGEPADTDDGVPGFGALVALVALIAAALLAAQRGTDR